MSDVNKLSDEERKSILIAHGYEFYSVQRHYENLKNPEGWVIQRRYSDTVEHDLIDLAWKDYTAKFSE